MTHPLIKSIHSIFSSLTNEEEERRTMSYTNQKKQQEINSRVGVKVVTEKCENGDKPHSMKMLRRKIDNIIRKENLSKKFRQELKCSEVVGDKTLPFIQGVYDFHKPWLSLTNDERANRINEFVIREYDDKKIQGKARCILMKGITGKLLEPTSVTYDSYSTKILDIPCLQYRDKHDYFYFL